MRVDHDTASKFWENVRVGDVVRMRGADGPNMTVRSFPANYPNVSASTIECVWFVGAELRVFTFAAEMLELAALGQS